MKVIFISMIENVRRFRIRNFVYCERCMIIIVLIGRNNIFKKMLCNKIYINLVLFLINVTELVLTIPPRFYV